MRAGDHVLGAAGSVAEQRADGDRGDGSQSRSNTIAIIPRGLLSLDLHCHSDRVCDRRIQVDLSRRRFDGNEQRVANLVVTAAELRTFLPPTADRIDCDVSPIGESRRGTTPNVAVK